MLHILNRGPNEVEKSRWGPFIFLRTGTKRSGKIEVRALHFPAKGTIPCIFVSQEKGKIDYICIQAISKLTVFIWESCTCQLFSQPNARFSSCNDQDFGNRPSDFRRFPTIFLRLPNSTEKYPKKLPPTFEYLRRWQLVWCDKVSKQSTFSSFSEYFPRN